MVLPNTSAKSVREWCAAGKLKGAVQLPSRRWQIPWAAVVTVLGFDPRAPETSSPDSSSMELESGDPLPGLEAP